MTDKKAVDQETKKTTTPKKQTTPKITTDDKKQKETIKKTVAKSGKRSLKAIEASEAKIAKETRKQESPTDNKKNERTIIKKTQQKTRSRLERRSKKYREHYNELYGTQKYSLEEATREIIKSSPVKFDATIELHVRLSVDPRQADQNIRDSVLLPAGNGKLIKIAAFVDDSAVDIAKSAGADLAGESEITSQLNSGNFSFDVLIATPAMMPKLGKFARVLGPRGLMPNPKSGTVTNDIAKAISESKAGKVEYRVDSSGIVHLGIGKASFKPTQILENLQAVLASIQANKPANLKTTFIVSAYLSTSMGPSIQLTI